MSPTVFSEVTDGGQWVTGVEQMLFEEADSDAFPIQ
jgi:hypothetical protein